MFPIFFLGINFPEYAKAPTDSSPNQAYYVSIVGSEMNIMIREKHW